MNEMLARLQSCSARAPASWRRSVRHRRADGAPDDGAALPPLALDLLFTFNIAMAVMVMMVAANMVRALDFAAFPVVLLLTTLMRLSLNVASTRVVLLQGHTGPAAAGKVIELRPLPDRRQLRRRSDRLRHPRGHQLHRRDQGCQRIAEVGAHASP